MRAIFTASLAVAVAASSLAARPARACGGCFQPPQKEVTVVTGHRMAFAVSQQQTVLWDQIQYSGAPQDFAWVLPVKAGAVVELSHDDFFAALDALTTPSITGPQANCGAGGGGVGCGSSANAAFGASASPGGGVQVISQSVVGPYDTVTVRSTDPNALEAWLVANGYDLPDSVRPTVAAYVSEGFDFLALRLAPGQGVQAMQPVRVVTPGAGLSLPLRMVAAGVGAQVGITLYVIGEGRYEAQNFGNAVVDDSQLVWLHGQSRSNYTELSQQLMGQNGGRTWLTEFAGPESLAGGPPTGCTGGYYGGGSYYGGGTYYGGTQALASLYFAQCSCAGPASAPDGGLASPCTGYDDLDVASGGIPGGAAWVTRIRAVLPPDALAEGDLVLQASAAQKQVSNLHTASVYDDPSYSPCGSTGGNSACTMSKEPVALGRWLFVGSLALAGGVFLRRRRSRSR